MNSFHIEMNGVYTDAAEFSRKPSHISTFYAVTTLLSIGVLSGFFFIKALVKSKIIAYMNHLLRQ